MPVIFEINTRFSGTTPLRTALGINEVEMAIEFIRMGKMVSQEVKLKNVAIFRTWSDIIVPMEQVDEFNKTNQLASPTCIYFPFLKN
jgi:carbamoyl-phosphate synthase large subunit